MSKSDIIVPTQGPAKETAVANLGKLCSQQVNMGKNSWNHCQ
jgi:hypothetical protein